MEEITDGFVIHKDREFLCSSRTPLRKGSIFGWMASLFQALSPPSFFLCLQFRSYTTSPCTLYAPVETFPTAFPNISLIMHRNMKSSDQTERERAAVSPAQHVDSSQRPQISSEPVLGAPKQSSKALSEQLYEPCYRPPTVEPVFPTVEAPWDWEDEERDSEDEESYEMLTSKSSYRGTLGMNNIIVDNYGTQMPRDVEELVDRHIRKQHTSPRLGHDEVATILQKINRVWDSEEATVGAYMPLLLLPFASLDHPSLAQVGDILWSRMPLPQNIHYPLVAPKTDMHLGYPTGRQSSQWTSEEHIAADHPTIRPYSQPTEGNLFPSFLIEVKSEAKGGTLYTAETQLATAGCHRVKSMIWILDQIDPNRTRKSSDAIVFSAVITARQVIAHVHYYDHDNDIFRMSFIDNFYLAKEIQNCVDFGKNIKEWLLEIQQPAVREALRKIYPITQSWNKGRLASTMTDGEDSFDEYGNRPVKKARIE